MQHLFYFISALRTPAGKLCSGSTLVWNMLYMISRDFGIST